MIKDRIKSMRLELGISQNELAKRAGYSHEFISQVERGVKSPSIKALKKIAFGLNVCPSKLFTSKQTPCETEETLIQDIQQRIIELSVEELKAIRNLLSFLPTKNNIQSPKDNITAITLKTQLTTK